MDQLLTILGHPNPRSLSGDLESAYAARAAAAGAQVERIRLADLQFDPILHNGYAVEQPLEPDLVHAQEAIARAQHVVFVFPTWWASTPALLKGFIDRVMLPGFAFRYTDGGLGLPEKLLKGRSARVITSMDTPRAWVALVQGRSLHHSFARSTLAFAGFSPVRERVLYGTHGKSRVQIERFIQAVERDAERDVRALRRRPALQPGRAGTALEPPKML